MEINFSVRGLPAPQGSKTARPVYRKGATGEPVPTGQINQVESSKRLRPWRDLVHAAAEDAVDRWQRRTVDAAEKFGTFYCGPVVVAIAFVFERPRTHYGTGYNKHRVKDSAPAFPTSAHWTAGGDLDKLVRGVLDAMTKVVYGDDSQVVGLASAWKVYGPQAGVRVSVRSAPTFLLDGDLARVSLYLPDQVLVDGEAV